MGKVVKLKESDIQRMVEKAILTELKKYKVIKESGDNHELAKLRTQYKLDSIMDKFKDAIERIYS